MPRSHGHPGILHKYREYGKEMRAVNLIPFFDGFRVSRPGMDPRFSQKGASTPTGGASPIFEKFSEKFFEIKDNLVRRLS